MDREAKLREIEQLLHKVGQLESELVHEPAPAWRPPRYYTTYHVMSGFVLGTIGAAMSLLFNIVGSLLFGQHPLQLIRVYLTFPLGESAYQYADNHVVLAFGVCLYLATGMLLGVPFQIVLSKWFSRDSFFTRWIVTTIMSLALWLLNFYVILSWVQPLLFGDNWIVRDIPWWVAATTHLVFGWTILLVQPLGVYRPFRRYPELA